MLVKSEIKKEHQVLMINKTTSFKKRAKGKKGNFKKNGKQVAAQVKKSKSGPKLETKCFYCKGTGHWKRNCPKYLADKKDGKVNKGICDIHVSWENEHLWGRAPSRSGRERRAHEEQIEAKHARDFTQLRSSPER